MRQEQVPELVRNGSAEYRRDRDTVSFCEMRDSLVKNVAEPAMPVLSAESDPD